MDHRLNYRLRMTVDYSLSALFTIKFGTYIFLGQNLGVVMDYGPSALFTIKFGTYIYFFRSKLYKIRI